MTPTATYIAEENCLQEISQMEKPIIPEVNSSHAWCGYYNRLTRYEKHLATLRKIPCDSSCKGLWVDQQEVVEGVDYRVGIRQSIIEGTINQIIDSGPIAFPLVPVKSEDQDLYWYGIITLVRETRREANATDLLVKTLKENYSLTKR